MEIYRELYCVDAKEMDPPDTTTSGPFANRETADRAALILLAKGNVDSVVVRLAGKESLLQDAKIS